MPYADKPVLLFWEDSPQSGIIVFTQMYDLKPGHHVVMALGNPAQLYTCQVMAQLDTAAALKLLTQYWETWKPVLHPDSVQGFEKGIAQVKAASNVVVHLLKTLQIRKPVQKAPPPTPPTPTRLN